MDAESPFADLTPRARPVPDAEGPRAQFFVAGTRFDRRKDNRGRARNPSITDEQRAARTLNTQQVTGQAIQKVSWWQEQIVDWQLLNPDKTQDECAKHFGVSPSWLSAVVNSDAFKEFRSLRMAAHQDLVSREIIDRVEGLGHLSLDILEKRIAATRDEIPLAFVKETAEMALKALGYGAKPSGGTVVQINNSVTASRDDLQRARERMRQQHPQLKVLDAADTDEAAGSPLPAPAGV